LAHLREFCLALGERLALGFRLPSMSEYAEGFVTQGGLMAYGASRACWPIPCLPMQAKPVRRKIGDREEEVPGECVYNGSVANKALELNIGHSPGLLRGQVRAPHRVLDVARLRLAGIISKHL